MTEIHDKTHGTMCMADSIVFYYVTIQAIQRQHITYLDVQFLVRPNK